jgi:predicted metallopeptidase
MQKMGVNEQENMQKQVKTITQQSPWYVTHLVSFTTDHGPIASKVRIIVHCRHKKDS